MFYNNYNYVSEFQVYLSIRQKFIRTVYFHTTESGK